MNNNQNFMDSKTLLAIAFSALIFMGWSYWMQKRYPDHFNEKQKVESVKKEQTNSVQKTTQAEAPESPQLNNKVVKEKVKVLDQTIKFSDKNIEFNIHSKGMGVTDYLLHEHFNRKKENKKIGAKKEYLPLETALIDSKSPLYFKIEQTSDGVFRGVAKQSGLEVIKTIKVNSKNYSIKTVVEVKNLNDSFKGVRTYLVEDLQDLSSGGMFSADQYNVQDIFIKKTNDQETFIVGQEDHLSLPPDSVEKVAFSTVEAASIGSQYFTFAFLNQSSLYPDFVPLVVKDSKTILGIIDYKMISRNESMVVEYTNYLGPKDVDVLETVDPILTEAVDFGFFGGIAGILHMGLQMFHSLTGNWGLAIILLTLLVRILLTPIILPSYKNMKKMSKLAPLMKDIQERYKDDPQLRGQEVMKLYKDHKVNPLGGCLPMFLQLPIFFALFQVLGKSVDLYQAPFYLWINDLSEIDPYYVLPVLSGVVMFFQMKSNPSNENMQPAQKKMMMVMPLVMILFFVRLPSGLNLYMFVSTLFGYFQQVYFINDKKQSKEKKVEVLN